MLDLHAGDVGLNVQEDGGAVMSDDVSEGDGSVQHVSQPLGWQADLFS